jgi:hypothetical protein
VPLERDEGGGVDDGQPRGNGDDAYENRSLRCGDAPPEQLK